MELLDRGTTDWNTSSMLIVLWVYVLVFGRIFICTDICKTTNSFEKPTSFSDFSLKIEAESAWRSFLLCQRNKRIFSWSCFCTYVHSILYGRYSQVMSIIIKHHAPSILRKIRSSAGFEHIAAVSKFFFAAPNPQTTARSCLWTFYGLKIIRIKYFIVFNFYT